MYFEIAVKIIFLVASLFMAMGSIGAEDQKTGERCAVITAIFTTALVALMMRRV